MPMRKTTAAIVTASDSCDSPVLGYLAVDEEAVSSLELALSDEASPVDGSLPVGAATRLVLAFFSAVAAASNSC
ncbi:hypothetical protein ABZS13_10275 [Lacticaseibacillus rhamnosus]